MATIIIPTPLRKFTQNQSRIQAAGITVGESIEKLVGEFPDLRKYIFDEQGNLRSYINFFLGDRDIRELDKEKTAINDNEILSIIPAIAGGSIF